MDSREGRSVSLRAVGDVALIGSAARSLADGGSPAWSETAAFLAAADLTFANLEMPMPRSSVEPSWADVSEELRGRPEALRGLLMAGLDVVCLANNHMMDWGAIGLAETIEALAEHGVATVGAGENLDRSIEPAVLERNGLRVGFAAFTPPHKWTATDSAPGAAPLRTELVRESLDRMGDVDARVVSLHWGVELSNYPTPQDRALAREIADLGVDLLLGHHPHVLQGVERLGRAGVVYSMGNFVFDVTAGRVQFRCDPWNLRAGYVAEAHLGPDGLASLGTVPTFLDGDGVGVLATGDDATRIERLVEEVSRDIEAGSGAVWEHAGGRIVGQRVRVLRGLVRDAGPLFVLRELVRIRPRHLRLLWGYAVSRMRRRSR